MREIKFRMWNKQITTFWYFGLDKLLRNAFGCPTLIDFGNMKGLTKPLMQYIGLKDKNGKEIYEGDIVKIAFFNHTCSDCLKKYNEKIYIGKVEFNKGYYILKTNELSDYMLHGFPAEELEVIGNIYENSELLKL